MRVNDGGAQSTDRREHAAVVPLIDGADLTGDLRNPEREHFAPSAPASEARERRRGLRGDFAPRRRDAHRHHDAALEIHLDLHPVAIARIRVAAEAAGQTATAGASWSRATTRASASTNRST